MMEDCDKAITLLNTLLENSERCGYMAYQDFNKLLEELGTDHRVIQSDNPIQGMVYAHGLLLKREMERKQ